MTALAPHVLYAVSIGGSLIDQVTEQNVSTGLQEIIEGADGGVDATFAAAMLVEPLVSFTTTDIKAALDAVGINGAAISSDVILFFQALAEGGTRQGATSHLKLTVVKGMVVPRTLNAAQGEKATISLDILPVSADGLASPITIATGQSLTGSPTVSAMWTLGQVKANNADLPDVDAQIDFGINVIRESADGQVYATFSAIMDRRPVISFTTPNVTALSTYGLAGAARASSTILTLRKMDEGATRVADATIVHISFVVNEGRISVRDVTGAHGERLGASMQITPTFDGTNAVIVIDTTAAIT